MMRLPFAITPVAKPVAAAGRRFSWQSAAFPRPLPAFDHTPATYDGPAIETLLQNRRQHLPPSFAPYYRDPVMLVEGKRQYLFDGKGRRFLDAFGGVVTVSVGHCHPKVNQAIAEQNALLQHTTSLYLNPQVAMYAAELAAKMPTGLSVCCFTNSGSEANDLAVLMARLFTGNFDIIALRNCYHGASQGSMGLTAHSTWRYNTPMGFGYHHAVNPDPFRGAFGNNGEAYARDVKDLIQTATPGRVAGFISETVQGVGGAVQLADGYLPAVYDTVRNAGGVCIADEVQTGFGRTGRRYWGFELQGVVPDIVTMAKGIGNGVPLGAVATTPEIAAVLSERTFFNTFGGNPVSSAAGRAVLQVVDEERLQENCLTVGQHMKGRLEELMEKHEVIGDVRGEGLILGVELVKDRKTKQPAPDAAVAAHERLKHHSVLVGKGGFFGNVIRIKPPMCFTVEDANYLVDAFDEALGLPDGGRPAR